MGFSGGGEAAGDVERVWAWGLKKRRGKEGRDRVEWRRKWLMFGEGVGCGGSSAGIWRLV